MTSLLEISDATIATPGHRILFDGLNLRLDRDHVALMGRNGVGKSTLLAVLAGAVDVERGDVKTRGRAHFVPQMIHATAVRSAFERSHSSLREKMAVEWLSIGAAPLTDILRARDASRGELRKLALLLAKWSEADILLLDEPTEDLDDAGITWLREWLSQWRGGLVTASHDPRLLEDFQHFFIASESGCHLFSGPLHELDDELVREHDEAEARYARNLNRLVAYEKRVLHVARRKDRKKRVGRCRELDRATPRILLNHKRSQVQVNQGRLAVLREQRLDALRQWCKSTRRALGVSLPLDLAVSEVPEETGALVVLSTVSVAIGDRLLVPPLDIHLGRQRIGVVGPNGAGKTTLLQVMLGRRAPTSGSIVRAATGIGSIEQGGTDWMLEESLLAHLEHHLPAGSTESPADLLVAHKFPLALGERPLASLSPGERVRAALIALFRQSPTIELLVLDEPTYSVDRVGRYAMIQALRAWRGGLVIASHDRSFLEAIGTERYIVLGPAAHT
jgi:ATPase subunit of ABC transporter with duplicated ATPase domains